MLHAFLSDFPSEVSDTPALEAQLSSALASCQATHPEFADHSIALAKSLAERVKSDPIDFASLALTDLYLCVATLAGDTAALVAFECELKIALTRVGARFRLSDDQRDELGQELLERLLLPAAERPARLAEFAAKGSLVRWLQAVATRSQLNRMRGKKREVLTGDHSILDALAIPIIPGLEPNKGRFRSALKTALGTALASLEAQDKLLLRMAYVEGVRLEGLGRALDVSRATAHRRLTKAREALAIGVEESMSEELSIPKEKLSSIRRLVQSQVSISLGRLLT
jgi:RNA polymerase sigma-70 factor